MRPFGGGNQVANVIHSHRRGGDVGSRPNPGNVRRGDDGQRERRRSPSGADGGRVGATHRVHPNGGGWCGPPLRSSTGESQSGSVRAHAREPAIYPATVWSAAGRGRVTGEKRRLGRDGGGEKDDAEQQADSGEKEGEALPTGCVEAVQGGVGDLGLVGVGDVLLAVLVYSGGRRTARRRGRPRRRRGRGRRGRATCRRRRGRARSRTAGRPASPTASRRRPFRAGAGGRVADR